MDCGTSSRPVPCLVRVADFWFAGVADLDHDGIISLRHCLYLKAPQMEKKQNPPRRALFRLLRGGLVRARADRDDGREVADLVAECAARENRYDWRSRICVRAGCDRL